MKTASAFLLLACSLHGQRQTFEVASIKSHPEPITFSSDPSISGTRVTSTASTLLDLMTVAYAVRYDRISGANGWIGSDHFDLAAKAEGDAQITKQEMRQMLQTLLTDRFQLKVHRELKEVAAYALVVARGGPRLKESAPGETGGSFVRGGAAGMHMERAAGTMEDLAAQLSFTAGRPVVDRTGLAGHYKFKLGWMPAGPATAAKESDVPDIFTAIREQLGLRLEPTKAAAETLVIDRAEKPSVN